MYTPKLTHEERRERRREIAQAYAAGASIPDLMAQFSLTYETVRRAIAEGGIPRTRIPGATLEKAKSMILEGHDAPVIASTTGIAKGTVYRHAKQMGVRLKPGSRKREEQYRLINFGKWAAVDWSMRDGDIAQLIGVTGERVRQVRKILRKPASPDKGKTTAKILLRAWLQNNRQAVEGLTVGEAVNFIPLKASRELIQSVCKDLGIRLRSVTKTSTMVTRQTLIQFVSVNPATGCWEWKGTRAPTGYGRVGAQYAHRFVFELFNGPMADGAQCLHKCDNPCCVNPQHLYAGTAKDNCRDAIVRGRRGGGPRFTASDVRTIRESLDSGSSSVQRIMSDYDVCYQTVMSVWRGNTYKDVLAGASA